jgi:DHA1 family inner membrane transport protein
VLLVVAVFAVRSPILAPLMVFGVGALGLSFFPSVQSVVMEVAGKAPALASATIQSAFNIANALGAALGGLALAAGLGLAAPPGVGALLSAIALVPAVSLVLLARRTRLRAARVPA